MPASSEPGGKAQHAHRSEATPITSHPVSFPSQTEVASPLRRAATTRSPETLDAHVSARRFSFASLCLLACTELPGGYLMATPRPMDPAQWIPTGIAPRLLAAELSPSGLSELDRWGVLHSYRDEGQVHTLCPVSPAAWWYGGCASCLESCSYSQLLEAQPCLQTKASGAGRRCLKSLL